MPLEVIIHLQTPAWKKKLRPYCKTIRGLCNTVYEGSKLAKIDAPWSVAVVLTDDATVHGLNRDYRNKDKPTNVLSFPCADAIEASAKQLAKSGETELGDIILSLETIEAEAKAQQKRFTDHASHLIIHGMLHLLGEDHEEPKAAKKMENREINLLKLHNIDNPYL